LGEGEECQPAKISSGDFVMFSKNSEKLESLIGTRTDFQGEFTVKGILRVDGRIDGRVNADCVVLSETGVIKGEIIAPKIIVGGKIEGNLRAQEIVEIKATGKVLGDIFTNKLSVTEGGEFNGKIEMKTEGNKLLDLESLTREG
jgi:cytoskeletal protein CcmA (bactofilin family)